MNITEYATIAPHGGELVDRRAPKGERDERKERAAGLRSVTLGARALSDLEMIATGVFSPLTGFMVREDYENVVESMRLANGLPWSLPITLSVSRDEAGSISEGEDVALADGDGRIVATMAVEDLYTYDKEREAREVFRTTDEEHPGVAALYRQKEVLVGGEITLLEEEPNHRPFPLYYYEPHELRAVFAERGWKRVVGFQTRNPVHRAHEYIQKSALETVDGLLLNPLVGETKSDDISAAVRMLSYETILARYYPQDRT
ncbi:MAG: sulfate adenylyltransferase, partial [Actinomycetota bacterium]|nr:sulfate adenylyltransferase [Actinomycetota bacterium]